MAIEYDYSIDYNEQMLNYYPEFIKSIREFQAMINAQSLEVEEIHEALTQILQNNYFDEITTYRGKNLLDCSQATTINTLNTLSQDGDVLIITPSENGYAWGVRFDNLQDILKVGETYTFSGNVSGHASSSWGWRIIYPNGAGDNYSNSDVLTITVNEPIASIEFQTGGRYKTNNDVIFSNLQLELGNKATSYEPYYVTSNQERNILRWEKFLGIVPLPQGEDDYKTWLNDRQETIIARLYNVEKLNTKSISDIVSIFTGGDAISYFKDSTIYVLISPPKDNKQFKFGNVEQELSKKVPAHLKFKVDRNYVTWLQIKESNPTWGDLKDKFNTWEEVLLYVPTWD